MPGFQMSSGILLLAIRGKEEAHAEAKAMLPARVMLEHVCMCLCMCVCVILITISFSSQSMPESKGFMESWALQGLWLP